MKKVFSCVLCFAMILGSFSTVFASESSVLVKYDNEASYEVTIPAETTIDHSNGTGELSVQLINANLEELTAIKVTINSENSGELEVLTSDGDIAMKNLPHLKSTRNTGLKIPYYIVMNKNLEVEDSIDSGSAFFLDNDDVPGECTYETIHSSYVTNNEKLYLKLFGESKVGSYTDTLTFEIELVGVYFIPLDTTNAPEDFILVNSQNIMVPEGMTWGEWINTEYNSMYRIEFDGKIYGYAEGEKYYICIGPDADYAVYDNTIVDPNETYYLMPPH